MALAHDGALTKSKSKCLRAQAHGPACPLSERLTGEPAAARSRSEQIVSLASLRFQGLKVCASMPAEGEPLEIVFCRHFGSVPHTSLLAFSRYDPVG